MDPVSERLNFPEAEEQVLEYWEKIKAFETCLKNSEGRPTYTFYDGPPFATGLPHYGHILAGTIKDTVTRFFSQKGYHVPRRFGWDCHGLPIEFEIEKELGIKTKEQILEYGIPNYNAKCRSIVMKYSDEWKKVVTRLGRWIDMDNNYKTMDTDFMESVWAVFKKLWDNDHVYRGVKVMPYSTGCTTPLSNFEAGMNYKDVSDPELYVTFQSVDDANLSYIAWTTTPWTLPSNLALCVHPDLIYVRIEISETGKHHIVMKDRLNALFPVPKKKKKAPLPYKIIEEFKGEELKGKRYEPLFDCFKDHEGAFQIITGTYVKSDSGTGVVHQAPGFGEEDYKAALAAGVITKDGNIPCPVDESGRFTEEVKEYKGIFVKDADLEITKRLKGEGKIFKSGRITHSYPFCWRSESPLLYKAVPCWFVKVEEIKEKLLENNLKTKWVPEFVQTKRFHNWLKDAHDWAISRSRYWGTPLPIWVSDDMEERIVVGSVEELYELSGVRVTDLHRENIDHITIPSKQGKGDLHRVPDVFDCWFESGSMPYAQAHYPFENKDNFENCFPADFVAEGIDQTRGWFYTLLVISTLLFDKPAFKNLIANGLVLAEDRRKMSKRLRNYPAPDLIINQYGSDALRMYLINSPVVRGETLCFKESGVHGVIRDMLLPWFNAYRFLVQNVQEYETKTESKFTPDLSMAIKSENVMDKWILAALQTLVAFSNTELEAYRLYTVLPRLVEFIEQLTNWYVRLNRNRLRGNTDCSNDHLTALNTLFEVLLTTTKTLAPFTPFFTEHVYQNLRKCLPESEDSVHFTEYPKPNLDAVNEEIEASVSIMQSIIELGRCARERRKIAHRQPLDEILVFLQNSEDERKLAPVMQYLYDELNVKRIVFSNDTSLLSYVPSPVFTVLGKKLGKQMKSVAAAIKSLSQEQLADFLKNGKIVVCEHELGTDEILVSRSFVGDAEIYEPSNDSDLANHPSVSIALNVQLTPELIKEGVIRHIVNRIQRLRKESGILVSDDIDVYYNTVSPLLDLLQENTDLISKRIGKNFSPLSRKTEDTTPVGTGNYVCAPEASSLYPETEVTFEIIKHN
mmetsp:Transcript_17506/g.29785  ORF Transcript_17506/g.29785 Transcript_17506/m.29785 type:complete len:1080 (-) Transcript_17506:88-3327(-)